MNSMTTAASGVAGLRPSTAAGRAALCRADAFAGLPEGIGRWRVMAAVRTAAGALDLTPMMLRLLEHYVDLTWDIDWTAGCEPVVHRPLVEIAAALGRTERQIRNVERALAERGLLAWRDSGNHHRHGRRDHRTGRLIQAYGVSLGPMGARARELIALGEAVRRDAEATRRLRIAVSALRRQLRATIEAALTKGIDAPVIASASMTLQRVPTRTQAADDRATLEHRHEILVAAETELTAALARREAAQLRGDAAALAEIGNHEYIDTDSDIAINGYRRSNERNDAAQPLAMHPVEKDTSTPAREGTSKPLAGDETGLKHLGHEVGTVVNKRKNLVHRSFRTNLHTGVTKRPDQRHRPDTPRPVSLELAIACISAPAREAFRRSGPPAWTGLTEAMRERCALLDISQQDWAEGCAVLGRTGAALCVVVIEHKLTLTDERAIRRPASYFRAMVERGRERRLHLDRSLHAIARRQRGDGLSDKELALT